MPRSTPQKAVAESTAAVTTPPMAPNARRRTKKKVRAREVVRRVNREFDARDGNITAQDRPRDMPSTGPARLEAGVIEPVPGPMNAEHTAQLLFMEEMVLVVVHESTDANADPYPMVGVNGRNQIFIRGEKQQVRRKFVERLARAKVTRYAQREVVDEEGARAVRNIPKTSLMYPFSVLHDPNPNGNAWLQKVLAE